MLLWVSGSQAILDCKVCCLLRQNAPRCVPSHTVSHSFTVNICQVYLHFVWLLVAVHQNTGPRDHDQLKEISGTENTRLTNIECFEPLLWPWPGTQRCNLFTYYQTTFGCERLYSSVDREEMVVFWLLESWVWPEPWGQQTNLFTWHYGWKWCIPISSLITNGWVIRKISPGQTFIESLKLYYVLDLENNNLISIDKDCHLAWLNTPTVPLDTVNHSTTVSIWQHWLYLARLLATVHHHT